MRGRLWTRWAAGLAATVLLAFLVAWFSGRMRGGKSIHFRLDDATGIEPGTGINLAGVRAGVVTAMRLDADPSREGLPRARVDVRLTPEAAVLVDPARWEIVVTTSPLPGFKAEVAFLRHEGGSLTPLPDGAWHSSAHSAVAKQISQAFDAILLKLRESSDGTANGESPLRNLLPGIGGGAEGGSRALADWMLNKEQSLHLTSILRNVDAITAEAGNLQREGGLARMALGTAAHADLAKAVENLALTAERLRSDLEQDGALLRLAFTAGERQKISDMLRTMELLGSRVNAIDLTPVHGGMQSLDRAREALDGISRIIAAQTARRPDGTPGELEEQLNRLPRRLQTVSDSLERATRSSEEIMSQTTEVLRKADLTLAYINQFLTGLKRTWVFRGAFNESLQYEDLAPFLVPPQGGAQESILPDSPEAGEGEER